MENFPCLPFCRSIQSRHDRNVIESNINPSRSAERAPTVADHRILRRVGVGAYGEVWLAQNVAGTLRAVKVVWRERFDHERTYEREFIGLQKFEPLSRAHEGLVDILQIGRDDSAGYFYYVMELADSADGSRLESCEAEFRPFTVAELVHRRGRLSAAECARIGVTLSEALAYLHAGGLVHRDVKPSNIIFVNGKPKLADIGLVASLGQAQSFVGTDGFIPPEGPGSPRADIYGLGKTLYEMATGKSRLDFPDLPGELREGGEDTAFMELNEILLRACAPKPEERHASADDLRGELLLVDAGRSIRRLRRNERRFALWRRVGVAALALLVAGAAALWVESRRAENARLLALRETQQRQAVEEKERVARQNLYAADMNLAQQAIAAGNYGRAEALLSTYAHPEPGGEMRGFEWFHFWRTVRGDSIGVLRGHDQVVSSLVLSPDGERLYSASFDTTIREWSLKERRETRRWTMPGSLFMTLAIDQVGSRLAGEGGNRPFSSLLDIESGNWTTNISSASPSIAFSPDSRHLVRGARTLFFDTNGAIEITDVKFNVERVLPQAGGHALFSPRGDLLVTGSWSDTLPMWKWPELERMGTLSGAGTALGLSFSPDGTRLAGVSREGFLRLWDVISRRLIAGKLTHGGAVIWSVAFSPDGSRIATAGNDQTVRVWDAGTLTEQHVFRGHGGEVWSVVWSRDGRQLFSASKDTTIRIWDATLRPEAGSITSVSQKPVFSRDNRYMAARVRDRGGAIWETASGRAVLDIEDAAEVGGFSADGGSVALLRRDWTFQRRKLPGGEILESKALVPAAETFTKRLLSPDGRWVVTGLATGEIFVHDTRRGGAARLFPGEKEMIVALTVSPDSRRLLAGCINRTAGLWDLETGELTHVFTGHRMAVGSVAFSEDGSLIATGSWDDTVRVWDASTRKELVVLGGHEGGVQAVAFSGDKRTLVSLTGTSALKFWNLPAQREAGVLQLTPGVHQGWLTFSPDGQTLAAVGQGEVMTLLRAPLENSSDSR
jgi:WD40 repeat protein